MSNGRHLYLMIIRIRVHCAVPTACQTTLVIKSRRRLIYALAVNCRRSVQPSIRCSVIRSPFISGDRGELRNWLAQQAGVIIYLRVSPENRVAVAVAQNNRSPNIFLIPRKRNNYYVRRCNYCGRLRSVAVNNERAAALAPIVYFPHGRITRCSLLQ